MPRVTSVVCHMSI